MKVVSTLSAALVGAFLFAGGAQAAPLTATGALPDIAASSTLTEPVACKVVKKRIRRHGRTIFSVTRICTPGHGYHRKYHRRGYH